MNAPPGSTSDAPVEPGAILAGKYRVERIIGRGGMGVVVEARHVALDERVALKFLLPEYAREPDASARFQREARAAAKIKGEHVARVSDVGALEDGAPYMVMEYLEGTDLAHALEQYGVCQIPDAIDYVLQACEAIAEAHAHGIVHRDLKPANLFLTRRHDGSPMIKVLDFGISKMSGGGVDNLTRTTTTMGSALYMSPEQMQETRGVDHRTDIYALGISLYELLAGKQPYYADTLPSLCAEVLTGTPTALRSLRAEVSDGLAAAIEKAYARDKEQRYQSIAELAAGLAPYAPVRSQTILDRIARMAGLPPPIAGAGQRPSGTDLVPAPMAERWAQSPSLASTAAAAAAQAPSSVAAQAAGGARQTGGFASAEPFAAPSIAVGGYQAPVSVKAAAAFAAGAGMPRASGGGAGSKVALVVAAAAFVLLFAAGGVLFWLRIRNAPDAAAASHEIGSGSVALGATAGAPAAPSGASAAPGEEPAPTASVSTSVEPTSTGASSDPPATGSAPATTNGEPATTSAGPTTRPRPAPRPTATGVMTYR